MPPKGWKKDAQGNYPTTSYIKEQEKITINDLLFPRSIIASLAKETHSSDDEKKLLISKDAVQALQRSATVFVNHLLTYARETALNEDRKSCNIEDVLAALDEVGLGAFKPLIREKLDVYQSEVATKKGKKKSQKETGTASDANGDVDSGVEQVGKEEEDDEEDHTTGNENEEEEEGEEEEEEEAEEEAEKTEEEQEKEDDDDDAENEEEEEDGDDDDKSDDEEEELEDNESEEISHTKRQRVDV